MAMGAQGQSRRIGLFCLAVTAVGWGLNWPIIKLILREWPPLSARGTAGLAAAIGLAAVALERGERIAIPSRATSARLHTAPPSGWAGARAAPALIARAPS